MYCIVTVVIPFSCVLFNFYCFECVECHFSSFSVKTGKCDIDKLIKSTNEQISYVRYNGVSDVWPYYKVVIDGVFSFHVRCVPCGTLSKWQYSFVHGLKALNSYVKI